MKGFIDIIQMNYDKGVFNIYITRSLELQEVGEWEEWKVARAGQVKKLEDEKNEKSWNATNRAGLDAWGWEEWEEWKCHEPGRFRRKLSHVKSDKAHNFPGH